MKTNEVSIQVTDKIKPGTKNYLMSYNTESCRALCINPGFHFGILTHVLCKLILLLNDVKRKTEMRL